MFKDVNPMKTKVPAKFILFAKLAPTFMVAAISIALAFGGSMGCSKHSPTATDTITEKDLGEVEVSDGIPAQVDMGGGRTCKIIPKVRTEGYLTLTMEVSEGGKVLASPRMDGKSGVPVKFYVDNVKYTLTPKAK